MKKKSKTKLFKRLIYCKCCGNRVEVNHKLRQYCDKCRGAKNK